jgi:ATP-binding cassette subfamily F protein 3
VLAQRVVHAHAIPRRAELEQRGFDGGGKQQPVVEARLNRARRFERGDELTPGAGLERRDERARGAEQRVTEQFVRTLLGCFLFSSDAVDKPVKVLSGGEKSRLALVKMLFDPPNFLLMDEPTTHLDMASIEALIGALEQFEGTVVFISHDVYFIREIANKVVHVNQGVLTHYAGNYQYYLDKTKAESAVPVKSVLFTSFIVQ